MRRERWIGLPEAVERLGVSRSTLYRMIRAGQLATARRGRTLLVADRSIRARLASEPRIPPFTTIHPIFRLMGKFRSAKAGPGSSDKYAALFGRR